MDIFVVLGSGWSLPLAGAETAMADAGLAVPSVPGHGTVMRTVGSRLLVASGRVHLYEGHSPDAVVQSVRYAAAAGCRIAVLTNAAGAIDPSYPVGSAVLISDQINMTGVSPLAGASYVDLSDLYSARLRAAVREVAPGIREGVYVGTHGPEFETPAEIRAYRTMGADLVGMSTVLEAIAARHAGMEVLGLSMVTNLAAGIGGPLDVDHVWDAARAAAPALSELLVRVVEAL